MVDDNIMDDIKSRKRSRSVKKNTGNFFGKTDKKQTGNIKDVGVSKRDNTRVRDNIMERVTTDDLVDIINKDIKRSNDRNFTLEDVYSVKNDPHLRSSVSEYGKHPGLSQLALAVERIDEGQHELAVIDRMRRSGFYRGMINVNDGVRKVVGLPEKNRDMYSVFRNHQRDVSGINYIVMSMTKTYEKNLGNIKGTLYDLIRNETDVNQKRKDLNESFEKVQARYQDSLQNLEELDRFEEPKKYAEAKIEYQEAKSEMKNFGFQDRGTSLVEIGYNERVNILETQKDIFEELLYTVKEMGIKTGVYQQILNDLAVSCEPTRNLAEAVSVLAKSTNSLDDIKNDMLETYRSDVQSILGNASQTELGRSAIESNTQLRQLSDELQNSSYNRAVQYDDRRRQLYDMT